MKTSDKAMILMVEDEPEFGRVVAEFLRKSGYEVVVAESGQQTKRLMKRTKVKIFVVDLGLPDGNGLDLCRFIRNHSKAPIVVLTARDVVEDKVAAFNVGADDYLVKPVSLKELLTRIARLLSRRIEDKNRSAMFSFDGVEFDSVSGVLGSGDRKVRLTKKEKGGLEDLLLKRGRALTRMEIMDHVWGDELDPFSNTVNMVVSSLRKKRALVSSKALIDSVHGLGYKFVE